MTAYRIEFSGKILQNIETESNRRIRIYKLRKKGKGKNTGTGVKKSIKNKYFM